MKNILYFFLALLLFSNNSTAQNYWWNKSTAYEIFVRSFYDSNGDGRGDFNGLTQKLDYLNDGNPDTKNDLGISLIWLMPINSSPSYHGYDVTDYKKVNPQYGNMQEFKTFINEAHNRGIKVIVDFVINHTSSQHPWFIKSAANDPFYRNFYRWENTPPNQTGPWGQQVWYPKNGSNYYALFWSEMPDLNYNYAPVRDSIFDAAKFWIKEIGVDGFRLDAVMYLYESGNTLKNLPSTVSFLKELNDSCEVWKANTLLLGEVWDTPESVALYTGKLDMCFDFNLAEKNILSIQSENPYEARIALNTSQSILDTNQFASFLTNHDQNRIIETFENNINKNKAAASLYLTQPGVPFLYYGEEVAMKGVKPDEDIRRPMQWTAGPKAGFTTGTPWRNINSNYTSYNVETLIADSNSIWNHYHKLIQIRNAEEVLQLGNLKNIVSTNNAIHSYLRTYENKDIVVLINTSNEYQSNVSLNYIASNGTSNNLLTKDLWTDSTFYISSSNGKYLINLDLGPYQTRILKFEEALSISKNKIEEFKIYPNPANNKLNIIHFVDKQYKLSIINSIGNVVYEEELNNEIQQEINLDFPSGVYFVQLKSDLGTSVIKLIKH